jgi:hypothetical protein
MAKKKTTKRVNSKSKQPSAGLTAKYGVTSAVDTKTQDKTRRLKLPAYRSFTMNKRVKHPVKLPSAFMLTKMTAQLLWKNKLLFVGITLVYGILTLVFVNGFSSGTNSAAIKSILQSANGGSALTSSVGIFATIIGSSGSGVTTATSPYQIFLLLFVSLALIWALREVLAGNRIRIRDAYYRGMTPLIPFILILLVIAFQLLPFILGASIYAIVTSNGIAVYAVERILWGLLFGSLTLLSLYLTSSSVFALYIVTLPEMTPLKALRSARQLVKHRRWTVLRKLLFLPLLLLLSAAVVMIPIILIATAATQWLFFILTTLGLAALHGYLYMLYRELLNE